MVSVSVIVIFAFIIFRTVAQIPYHVPSSDSFCSEEEENHTCHAHDTTKLVVCRLGKRQSPIDLPLRPRGGIGEYHLALAAYRASSFRLTATESTVSVDFDFEGSTPLQVPFPDPEDIFDEDDTKNYTFAWAQLNPGPSQHSVDEKFFDMEVQLWHYLAEFTDIQEALFSDNKDAIAIISVFVDTNVTNGHHVASHALAPIINHLLLADHKEKIHGQYYVRVNEPLDLTPLLTTTHPAEIYSYRGSLINEPCSEIINWFVLKHPYQMSPDDFQLLMDYLYIVNNNDTQLTFDKRRPQQNSTDRIITLSEVKTLKGMTLQP